MKFLDVPQGSGNGGRIPPGLGYSVLDEGAKADANDVGGTSDSVAFQKAMDKAWGTFGQGGTVLIPPGVYHLAGAVQLRSNVQIIGYGATIRKYSHSGNYSAFWALSGTEQGYGSSVENVTIEGLTFRGSFKAGALSGCGVTLHHSDQVTFRKCRWTEAIITGHAADSMGTRGTVVDDCVFEGFLPQPDREYTEAIQVDYSKISNVVPDAPASYDGLPTIDLTVKNSRFVPLTIDGTTYPAPNPIGSHTRVAGRWHDNIKLKDNYIEGCHTPVTTDAFALSCKGWVHFFGARNVKSIRNTFVNVGGREARVFHANTISSGTALADVGVSNAAAKAMTPMPMHNFTSEGDEFVGFTHDAIEGLIHIEGTSGTFARDVKIVRPVMKDSWSTPGVSANRGAELVHLENVVGVQIEGPTITDARSLGYFNGCAKVNISGGYLKELGAYNGRFVSCTDVTVNGVHVNGHGGGWYFHTNCKGVEISGGSIVGGRADAILTKHITFSSTTEFSVHDVRMPKDANGYTAAIDVLANSKGKVKENITEGWDPATLVNLGTGSVVETGAPPISWDTMPPRSLGAVLYLAASSAYEARATTRTDVSFRWFGPVQPTVAIGFVDGVDIWENVPA